MSGRIEELVTLIRRHQELYYKGQPAISDSEFDLLWDELHRLDPTNPLFDQVGEDLTDGYPKRQHVIPMGSQDKAANPEAFRKWAVKVGHPSFIVQHKMDGASMELQYQDGVFVYGVTRGNGIIGDDITENVRKMKGVPGVAKGFTGGVRGEVLMSREVHATYHAEKANTRNAANGLMKRKDGVGVEHLQVICYDAVATDSSSFFGDETAKLQWLDDNGFQVVIFRECATADEVIAYRESVADEREIPWGESGALAFDIDGLVVKSREIDLVDAARPRPEKQIAFKFELEEAASTLVEVIWNPSGSLYTPIGVIEPVRLAGTTVQRANLVNPRLIREMGLLIGSRVAVTKRGEIIPKIERVLENPADATRISYPAECETCGTALVDDDTRLFCPNEGCPKRAFHRLRKWIGILDIRDFGDVILKQLFDGGVVSDIPDLYGLSVEDLTQFERMGEILAGKIVRNLNAVKEVSLSTFVAGLNIEGVGELIVDKVVAAGYDTLDKLMALTAPDLAEIKGIGEILAETILTGLSGLRTTIMGIVDVVRIAAPVTGDLTGRSFCFTGSLETMTRSQAQDLVREAGGGVKTSVTADLTYLVTNDPKSGSSKNKKARDLGVELLTEKEFVELIGE